MEKKHEGNFWGAGKIPHVHLDICVHICKNSPEYLRLIYTYTLYVCYTIINQLTKKKKKEQEFEYNTTIEFMPHFKRKKILILYFTKYKFRRRKPFCVYKYLWLKNLIYCSKTSY